MVAEAGIMEQLPKAFQAYTALADMFMPVHPGAQLFFGIIEVKKANPVNADAALKFRKSSRIGFRSADIVTRSKNMTGIHTHSQALG